MSLLIRRFGVDVVMTKQGTDLTDPNRDKDCKYGLGFIVSIQIRIPEIRDPVF